MPDLRPGKYAIFETSLGEITCELFPQHAPQTVENFVGLATGTKEFTDPKTRQETNEALQSAETPSLKAAGLPPCTPPTDAEV
jgi:cyclophilin family peptidyl-prolyl cis-trans isomerase